MVSMAVSNNLSYVDEFTRNVSYASMVTQGLVYTPGNYPYDLHLLKNGYAQYASDLLGVLAPTAAPNGTVSIFSGGTGATTASLALQNLLPSQSGLSGSVLTTNGTSATWGANVSPGGTSGQIQINNGSGGFGGLSYGNTITNLSGVLNTSDPINAQSTATSYTVTAADMGKTITHNATSAVALTLPQAGTTGFAAGTSFSDINAGTSTVTITPTTSTINGKASVSVLPGQSIYIVSDGSNWWNFAGSAVTWPNAGALVVSGGPSAAPSALAEADGACAVGAGGVWTTGSCSGTSAVSFPADNYGTGASIAVGSSALAQQNSLSASFGNTVYGYKSMSSAGMTTAAAGNTVMGYQAEQYLTGNSGNTAVGFQAMQGSSSAEQAPSNNTAIGYQALKSATYNAANLNTAIGYSALSATVAGGGNVAVGGYAAANSSGSNLIAIGAAALQLSGAASNSIGIGNNTCKNATGSNNVCVGTSVGSTTLTSGGSNILIGTSSSVDTPAAATSNWLNIGNGIYATLAAPTIGSGFGTSPSVVNGTSSAAFTVNVGTGGTAASGVVMFPTAAPHGWACDAVNSSSSTALTAVSVPTSTTSVTISSYSRTSGSSTAFNASDILVVKCAGY